MDTNFSDADNAFRDEVRAFIAAEFDDQLRADFDDYEKFEHANKTWERKLNAKGWLAPGWPAEYGGPGWSATQKFIFETERALAGVPDTLPFGLKMVGPILIAFGTDEQKKEFLPKILTSEHWWCQGYSEPGSGSDLASLQTRADRDGDDYVVNGGKIWTSAAQYADWMFCLVRTDNSGKKQQGISFLLIDMKSPGITIKPIVSIDGGRSLNEVLFDDVRVPVANRIGEEHQGWTYAKALLAHERSAIANVADCKRGVNLIKEWAAQEVGGGQRLLDDPIFQSRLSDLEIELMALEYTELRVLAALADGEAPGPESSLLKIKGTEMQQAFQELSMEVAGYYAGALPSDLPAEVLGHEFGSAARKSYMYGRASTIYGGSNEVQRNVIAKAVLGL